MSATESQWEKIYRLTKEFAEWFPDGMVLIGGIAVYLHSKDIFNQYIEYSHDSDFCLSLMDLSDMRDLENITQNKRLGRHQIVKQGVEFDVYVEHQNKLIIPFKELLMHSVVIDEIRCACLPHLLILKMKALDDREYSTKGEKDLRDIVKIVNSMTDTNKNRVIIDDYFSEDWKEKLKDIGKMPAVFQNITNNDRHVAKKIKNQFNQKINFIFSDDRNEDPSISNDSEYSDSHSAGFRPG